jgi:hypothetical protein
LQSNITTTTIIITTTIITINGQVLLCVCALYAVMDLKSAGPPKKPSKPGESDDDDDDNENL